MNCLTLVDLMFFLVLHEKVNDMNVVYKFVIGWLTSASKHIITLHSKACVECFVFKEPFMEPALL